MLHEFQFDNADNQTEAKSHYSFDPGELPALEMDAFDANIPTHLFGLELINTSLKTAARSLAYRALCNRRSTFYFVNAHCINNLKSNHEYADALDHADALLPDGSGLALAAKLAGRKIEVNLNGTDLFPHICDEASKLGLSLFLLGGAPGVAATVGKKMRQKHAGLQIAGAENGYFNEADEEDLVDRINNSNASILLVGLGVPLQELWIARNRTRLKVPVVMGVGGLFDYYSDRIPRAPLFLRKAGMEWSWRLMQEPRRLAKRYLWGNFRFIGLAIAYAWDAGGHSKRYAGRSKRTLDLVIALIALILLGPLFGALCLLITLEDRGPVFFRQTRIGANGKPFKMWKFRSMAVDAEARRQKLLAQSERDGVCFKMKHDPRITSVGRWIRRLSLDELPQILNVIRGDMSIVGPRPALPQEVITYDYRARARLQGTPGLTCTWQVSGRADIPFEQQVELDVAYLKDRSFLRDIILIAKTVPAVISGRGAY
jgi:exopolysaccharide biosynthesis WecB/TagA/CpsF family protein